MGGERAGPVDTDALSGKRRSFVFGLKCKEPNMSQVLGLLAPLKSIIYREISDGSDALSKSSAPDDDEVRRGKVFMVGRSSRSYGYYEAHACATAALSRAIKPYNISQMIEPPADFLCPILPPFVSTYSRRGGGLAGVGSPYLCTYPLVEQMARVGAFWMKRELSAGSRSLRKMYDETLPEMEVSEMVETRQNESLGGSAASGGGGGGRDVHDSSSFDASGKAFRESLSSGMMDVGRSGSDLDVRRQRVMRHFRQELQLQFQQLQKQRPLPLDFPCSPHHQGNKHHNHHRPTPKSDLPAIKGRQLAHHYSSSSSSSSIISLLWLNFRVSS